MAYKNEGFSFLNAPETRRHVRMGAVFLYFVLFQSLVFVQKPFLQLEFAIVFYLSFGLMFAARLSEGWQGSSEVSRKSGFVSYFVDTLALIVFMRFFPHLSSFILVLQLFLLFLASFDLDLAELSVLGFICSLGTSLMNIYAYQAGTIQNILSLALFNLSYLSVIIISRQLNFEFSTLQTDLSKTRKKWKSQEQFLNTLVGKLPFGLVVIDQNQEAVLKNTYLTRNTYLAGAKLNDLIRRYSNQTSNGSADIAFLPDGANEKRLINLDFSNYYDEEIDENLSLYLIRDVTDIRRLENQVRQSEKLAAIGQLAAGIAHEIRNPLAGISGSIQLLSQDFSDPTQQKLMNIILREIDRLNVLITEFLDYAKPETVPDTEMNLTQVVEDVILNVKKRPDVATDFQWSVEAEEVFILGFPEKLKQAVLNILINAVQAIREGDQKRIDVKLKRDADGAVLSIRDYGSGMSDETKKKMFEPFHTTKIKGTGLGLAVTHKILELHRAEIEIESELNKGTEFIIKIPVVKGR